jgi:PAS domain S-box-containing protein
MQDVREIVTDAVREICNAMNAGVYLTDRSRTIVFWNRRAEEITGYKAEQVVGTACYDGILEHVDKEGRALCGEELCPLHRSIVTEQPSPAPVIVYAKSASGERVPVSTSTAPVHDAEGNVIGGVEVLQDERDHLVEMELARATQLQLLDAKLPTDDRISFAVESVPLEMIGGDYYRVDQVSDDVFSLFVADVAGHGVSAALFIALVRYLTEECADKLANPAVFVSAINDRMCERIPGVGFVTALCTMFDVNEGKATCCSAGHPPALLQSNDGSVQALECRSFPLGLNSGLSYETVGFDMRPGDRFLAYTDGITETRVEGGQLLGTEGLISMVQEAGPEGRSHGLRAIYDALIRRCTTHMPEDDITLASCMML